MQILVVWGILLVITLPLAWFHVPCSWQIAESVSEEYRNRALRARSSQYVYADPEAAYLHFMKCSEKSKPIYWRVFVDAFLSVHLCLILLVCFVRLAVGLLG